MADYVTILTRKFPGSNWELNGDDYEGLVWKSETDKPTKVELDDLWDEVKEEIAAEKVAAKAKREALLDRLGLTEEEAKILLS